MDGVGSLPATAGIPLYLGCHVLLSKLRDAVNGPRRAQPGCRRSQRWAQHPLQGRRHKLGERSLTLRCPKARGLGVSPQTSATSLGLDKTRLVPLPALQPLREATLTASLCILNHVKTIPGAQLPSYCLQKKAHRFFHAVNVSLAILPSWL